ncbi:MAG: N-acetylmuramoyl-L-alanine amidase [Kaiparowitsia implicata GSE-PSE-MK54-09C]|jgi:hypothetical protein|nr:N-acetylmuramoyl-L-alanine amidase [Kaiparowitsia implicata GSE-PSE-MK54-09C]
MNTRDVRAEDQNGDPSSSGDAAGCDGIVGPQTIRALQAAVAERSEPREPARVVPSDWIPAVRLDRIIVHWTAGAHRASGLNKSHYYILIEADGMLVRGTPSIAANRIGGTGPRASGSIGVSLCCMAGAIESLFKAGSAAMPMAQWETLPAVLADLCRLFGIPVTPKTVLSHAEVQAMLGIKQRGKWDISRLAFEPKIVGAKACGDRLRRDVPAIL